LPWSRKTHFKDFWKQVLGYGLTTAEIIYRRPGTSWAAQPKPTEPEDALQVREPHLDLLAFAP
jgi:hypothetical protein